MTDRLLLAAQARALAVTAPGDRPSQRRAAEVSTSKATTRAPSLLDVRAKADSDGPLVFHGVASVTERAYEMWDAYGPYNEVIAAGAFAESLAREGLDVPLVLGHDSMRRIARTTNGSLILAETADGLDVLAELDSTDADVAYILPKLRAGLIDEMSFMFMILSGQWSPDYSEYRITRVDIHRGDVAIVGYGANPFTSAEARKAPPAHDMRAALLALALAR